MSTIRDQLQAWRVAVAPPSHPHSRTGWVNVDCPWCMSAGKFHLGFNELWGNANCWRCGPRNPYEAITMLAPRVARGDVVEYLRAHRGRASHRRVIIPSKPLGQYTEPPVVGPMTSRHRRYLSDRGFDPDEVAAVWGVRGIGFVSPWRRLRLAWRLFIPVVAQGRQTSWLTRAVRAEASLRYIAAPPECERESIKDQIYGIDFVRHTVVIVEGATDVWRIGRGAAATLGTSVTDGQILTLSLVPRRVVLFDNSAAAQRRARSLANELAAYPGETLVAQIDGSDPAEAPQSEIDEVRARFLA